jgi:hypothetical protein
MSVYMFRSDVSAWLCASERLCNADNYEIYNGQKLAHTDTAQNKDTCTPKDIHQTPNICAQQK